MDKEYHNRKESSASPGTKKERIIRFCYRLYSSEGNRAKNIMVIHKTKNSYAPNNWFHPSRNPMHMSFKKKQKPLTPMSAAIRSSFNTAMNATFTEGCLHEYSPPITSRKHNNGYVPHESWYYKDQSVTKMLLSSPGRLKTTQNYSRFQLTKSSFNN
ncbi:unnamed protein product [Blepharisma stoltei]|uniref:Uncharacterized protein n=1 Tax=Blepharisma stoltei TaxID=1481888 RepID=A0AAU9J058_9CILI|nr:unnamed protein product [Blepharisma stoltei]